MLELRLERVRVKRCLAGPATLDALADGVGLQGCRVAPDELLLIGDVSEFDPAEGLVVDETGAWAAWTLAGSDSVEALGRLSALPPDPGFLQGVVADVSAKVIVAEEEIQLLVPASLAHHVEERMRAACSDLLGT